MTDPIVKLEVFLSDDKKYIFARCCIIFESVTIGDFDQIVLGKTMVGAFEDLNFRLGGLRSIDCESDSLESALSSLIGSDVRCSCLPLGIETFDGDIGAFFNVMGKSYIVLKPWGEKNIFTENLIISHYRSLIALSIENLKRQMSDLESAFNERGDW